MQRTKELFSFSLVTRRILGIPLIFLVFYYIGQINYQYDDPMGIMCPNPNFLPPTAAPAATATGAGATATGAKATRVGAKATRATATGAAATGAASTGVESAATKKTAESCRKFAKTVLEDNNANYATITKLITFLLGFYVSNIINRWWNKVRYLLAHIMYIHILNQMRFPKNIHNAGPVRPEGGEPQHGPLSAHLGGRQGQGGGSHLPRSGCRGEEDGRPLLPSLLDHVLQHVQPAPCGNMWNGQGPGKSRSHHKGGDCCPASESESVLGVQSCCHFDVQRYKHLF